MNFFCVSRHRSRGSQNNDYNFIVSRITKQIGFLSFSFVWMKWIPVFRKDLSPHSNDIKMRIGIISNINICLIAVVENRMRFNVSKWVRASIKKRFEFQMIIVYLNSECRFKNRIRRPFNHHNFCWNNNAAQLKWSANVKKWSQCICMCEQKTKNILFGFIWLGIIEWQRPWNSKHSVSDGHCSREEVRFAVFLHVEWSKCIVVSSRTNQKRIFDDSHKNYNS